MAAADVVVGQCLSIRLTTGAGVAVNRQGSYRATRQHFGFTTLWYGISLSRELQVRIPYNVNTETRRQSER